MDKITIARGDGIGPEIMQATLYVLEKAQARLEYHEVEIGEKVYLRGHKSGIEPSTWETILQTKAFLKAPITTPQGGGFRSLNVTIRTMMGLYANIRPCRALAPFVETKHPDMDVVVVRENEEDLYAGIEYRQTPDVCESIKLISRPGSEKIVRYAFEYAVETGRKKVTCFTKDNIMKFSDGLFHSVFEEVAKEYPSIESEHWIVDIGAAKLADTPEVFDVVVVPNLYGDILSDITAQISGSVGMAGSANIGLHGAMFEAIHGSAPRRANQNVANPSGLLMGAVQMLAYLGQSDCATAIHNAWLLTIEEGIHTYDIYKEGISKQKVGTQEFAEAISKNLGKTPSKLSPAAYKTPLDKTSKPLKKAKSVKRELVGADIFFYSQEKLKPMTSPLFTLEFISNRGARIYPEGLAETFCVDHYRARFTKESCTQKDIIKLQESLSNYDIIKVENLYTFDGEPGYSN